MAAETEASSLYDWAMRTLQDAGRAARDDTSTAPLRLVDTPTFRLEVRDKYSEAVSSLEKQLRAAVQRLLLGDEGVMESVCGLVWDYAPLWALEAMALVE